MVRGMLCPNGNGGSLMNVFDERQKGKSMCIFDNKQGGNLSYFQNMECSMFCSQYGVNRLLLLFEIQIGM